MLSGDRKTAYQREYMRKRRAAAKAGRPATRAELEVEVERLRELLAKGGTAAAKIAKLEAEIARLNGFARMLGAKVRAADERARQARVALKQVGRDATPEAAILRRRVAELEVARSAGLDAALAGRSKPLCTRIP